MDIEFDGSVAAVKAVKDFTVVSQAVFDQLYPSQEARALWVPHGDDYPLPTITLGVSKRLGRPMPNDEFQRYKQHVLDKEQADFNAKLEAAAAKAREEAEAAKKDEKRKRQWTPGRCAKYAEGICDGTCGKLADFASLNDDGFSATSLQPLKEHKKSLLNAEAKLTERDLRRGLQGVPKRVRDHHQTTDCTDLICEAWIKFQETGKFQDGKREFDKVLSSDAAVDLALNPLWGKAQYVPYFVELCMLSCNARYTITFSVGAGPDFSPLDPITPAFLDFMKRKVALAARANEQSQDDAATQLMIDFYVAVFVEAGKTTYTSILKNRMKRLLKEYCRELQDGTVLALETAAALATAATAGSSSAVGADSEDVEIDVDLDMLDSLLDMQDEDEREPDAKRIKVSQVEIAPSRILTQLRWLGALIFLQADFSPEDREEALQAWNCKSTRKLNPLLSAFDKSKAFHTLIAALEDLLAARAKANKWVESLSGNKEILDRLASEISCVISKLQPKRVANAPATALPATERDGDHLVAAAAGAAEEATDLNLREAAAKASSGLEAATEAEASGAAAPHDAVDGAGIVEELALILHVAETEPTARPAPTTTPMAAAPEAVPVALEPAGSWQVVSETLASFASYLDNDMAVAESVTDAWGTLGRIDAMLDDFTQLPFDVQVQVTKSQMDEFKHRFQHGCFGILKALLLSMWNAFKHCKAVADQNLRIQHFQAALAVQGQIHKILTELDYKAFNLLGGSEQRRAISAWVRQGLELGRDQIQGQLDNNTAEVMFSNLNVTWQTFQQMTFPDGLEVAFKSYELLFCDVIVDLRQLVQTQLTEDSCVLHASIVASRVRNL